MTDTEINLLAYFEKSPDLVCVASREGYFKKVNDAVIQRLGYPEEELYRRPIRSFVHPDDREATKRTREQLLNGKTLHNFENRYITASGDIIWMQWTSIYFSDHQVVFAIAKDITERKNSEKEIQDKYSKFKNLASHFKSSMEADRKYLAAELHEELAQLASVVKMDIGWISTNAGDLSEQVRDKVVHALVITDMLIDTIRRMSFSMSPNMLDDLGLDATLEWYCKEFSHLNGIDVAYSSDYNESDLTQEMRIDFFRICQEALANVVKHSDASVLRVSITDTGDKIVLVISDNGKGFDMGQNPKRNGITRMLERAASINAELQITSDEGNGTQVSLAILKNGSREG